MIKDPLEQLAKDFGMSVIEMLKQATFDSISPGICVECGYSTEVEPDNDAGWCEECNKNTVKSACVLAGII